MQPKIIAFFKPSAPPIRDPTPPSHQIDARDPSEKKNYASESPVTYKRRRPNPIPNSSDGENACLVSMETERMNKNSKSCSSRRSFVGKVLNKKRSYAQYHLEFGQSDFLLHACAVCGLMYARGDEEDEKVHKAFHKDYDHGIQYKGWQDERVVDGLCDNGGRVVLVLDGDPPAHRHKVEQVVGVMQKELGFSDGKLLHKLCKVYLYISSRRIVGCLIAEPIKTAHRIIPRSASEKHCRSPITNDSGTTDATDSDTRRSNLTLKFGSINFQREVIRRRSAVSSKVDEWDSGAILCEQEPLPVRCGIRAIWVVPSSRRKGIASRLLDAVRRSFCEDNILDLSHCAFSSPTSAGKAFASRYCNNTSFLVYI